MDTREGRRSYWKYEIQVDIDLSQKMTCLLTSGSKDWCSNLILWYTLRFCFSSSSISEPPLRLRNLTSVVKYNHFNFIGNAQPSTTFYVIEFRASYLRTYFVHEDVERQVLWNLRTKNITATRTIAKLSIHIPTYAYRHVVENLFHSKLDIRWDFFNDTRSARFIDLFSLASQPAINMERTWNSLLSFQPSITINVPNEA